MHLIITDAWLGKSRTVHLDGPRLAAVLLALAAALVLLCAGIYRWVLVPGAQAGWPVVGSVLRIAGHDEDLRRERFLRENLDAMARKVGEMQARMMQLESLGERLSGLAGMNPADIRRPPGQGGALVAGRPLTIQELQATLAELDRLSAQRVDLLTVMESRLVDQKVRKMLLPTQEPVPGRPLGSAFGWRIDPFTGRSALHTGLDFQADTGTAVLAAAGGIVVAQEFHPAYGNMVEVDHGGDLVTRYAHASRVLVKRGDIVRRGQKLTEVGTSGRSTGPHLHFEVLVRGVQQDPRVFLDAGRAPGGPQLARRGASADDAHADSIPPGIAVRR